MPQYSVERYVPRLDAWALAGIAERVERAAAELAATGQEISWLRSVAWPEEETCFCFFAAATPGAVVAANERAGVDYERVSEVVSLEAPPVGRVS